MSQNPEVMGAHSLFLRFHNLVAKSFHKAFPEWDDEKLYQWTRKFTIAVYQNILCDEFVRIYIGKATQDDCDDTE